MKRSAIALILIATLAAGLPSCSKKKTTVEELVADFCTEVCGATDPCRCTEADRTLLYAMASSEYGQAGWSTYVEETIHHCRAEWEHDCEDDHTCQSTCQNDAGEIALVGHFEAGRLASTEQPGSDSIGMEPFLIEFDRSERRAVTTSSSLSGEYVEAYQETYVTTYNTHLERTTMELVDGPDDFRVRTTLTRNDSGAIVQAETDEGADGTIDETVVFDPPCRYEYEWCQPPVVLGAVASQLLEDFCGEVCGDVSPCYCVQSFDSPLLIPMTLSSQGQAAWEGFCAYQCSPVAPVICECQGATCRLSCLGDEVTASFVDGRLASIAQDIDAGHMIETFRYDATPRRVETTLTGGPGVASSITYTTYNPHWRPVLVEADLGPDGSIDSRVTVTTDEAHRLIAVESDLDGDGVRDGGGAYEPACEPPYVGCLLVTQPVVP